MPCRAQTVDTQFTKSDNKSTDINQTNKYIYLHPIEGTKLFVRLIWTSIFFLRTKIQPPTLPSYKVIQFFCSYGQMK